VTRFWPLLFTLAAAWGASYLFIKVAVEGGLAPAPLMAARSAIAAVLLFGYLWHAFGAKRAVGQLRRAWRPALALGAVGAAIPFWLVGWGETHIDSGIAAIAQSTVPIFTVVLSWRFLPHERIRPAQAAGIGVGLVGVAVLAGVDPSGGWWVVTGTLAVVLASLAYASGNIIAKRHVHDIPGPVLATGAMIASTAYLLVPAILRWPSEVPTRGAIASLLALAVVGTAGAQLVFYRTLRLYGSTRVSLVTYLMPGFALVYGALLLGEPITAAALGGLALILLGVALGSGRVGPRRRTSADGRSAATEVETL
jgi:drug/metabolite transporter (DMT)-like permease